MNQTFRLIQIGERELIRAGLPEEVTAWQRDLSRHGVCFRSREEAPVSGAESAGVGEGESLAEGTGVRSSESGFHVEAGGGFEDRRDKCTLA